MSASPTSDSGPYRLIDQLADEFAERYRRGERPSLTEYIDRHPGLTDEIRELFPALARLGQAEEELHRDPPEGGPQPALRQLGDFRIVREVGRGGMGVVYEAEQVSLGRRVALKVLPQHAAHDRRAMERFRREARAAARLHHTNIVPIFEVGQEGEVGYYAMQFIRGQGLDGVIDELRRLRDHPSSGGPASPPPAPASPMIGTLAEDPGAVSPGGVDVSRAARSLLTGQFAPGGPGITAAGPGPARESVNGTIPATSQGSGPAERGPGAATDGRMPPAPPQPVPVRRSAATQGPTTTAVLPGGSQLSGVEAGDRGFFHSVAHVGRQVAQALAYAHARGVVHRDIKPSNLLLDTEGVVWITDFGLAKAEDDGLTRTGDVLGTLRYMAPERLRGEGDGRADIYALGLTLYELLTLRPAFDTSDRLRLIERIKGEEPIRPRSLDARIPRDLETILLKAADKDPLRRYATSDELAEDLRRFLDGEPIRARRVGETERIWKWAKRRPALSATLALLVVSLVIGTVVSTSFAIRANAHAERAREQAEDERAARAEAERHLYISHIARAQLEWRANNVRGVERILGGCPPGLRGWEWHFLKRLCHAELLDLEGHSGWVQEVAFSPDGRRIASAGGGNPYAGNAGPAYVEPVEPGEAIVWDATTGARLRTLGHPDVVDGLAFSPDGRTLLTGCRDGKARLWEVETGWLLDPPIELPGRVRAVAFSPDGRTLALGLSDGTIRLLDAADRGERRSLSRGKQRIASFLAFSPDGRLLASTNPAPGLAYGALIVWDLDSGTPTVIREEGTWSLRTAFSPDGLLLAGATEAGIRLWDPATGSLLRTIAVPEREARDVAFSPDGRSIAAALADGTVRLWEVARGTELGVLRGHDGRVEAVAFSPDGQRLVSGGIDGRVKLWDRNEDLEHGGIADPLSIGETEAIAFNEDGHLVQVGRMGSTNVFQLESGTLLDHRVLPLAAPWIAPGEPVSLDATGRWLAGVPRAEPRIVRCWDARTGRARSTLAGHSLPVHLVAISPGGRWIATCGRESGPRTATGLASEVLIWDGDGGPPRPLDLGPGIFVHRLAFSPGGDRLAWSGMRSSGEEHRGGEPPVDRLIGIVETASGREERRFTGVETSGEGLTFSPDGHRLAAVGTANLNVRIWDLETGRVVSSRQGPPDARDVAFSPDGRRLAVAGRLMITLLDAKTGEALLILRGLAQRGSNTHGFNPRVRFSPDGRQLAAVTFDEKDAVAIWSAVQPTPEQRMALAERRAVASLLRRGDLDGLESHPPVTAWESLGRALLNFRAARLDRAESDLARAMALRPGCVDTEPKIKDLCAGLGRWKEAASSWDLTVARSPRNAELRHRLIVSRLMAGDREGYRRACAEAVKAFERGKGPNVWQVALACGLAPDSAADPAVPVRLAEEAVARDPRFGPKRFTLGLTLYRAGEDDRAIRHLNESLAVAPKGPTRALAWPVLAMAHHRLGHAPEARRWLDRARSVASGAGGSRPGEVLGPMSSWWDGAEFVLLRREAEALVPVAAPELPDDVFAADAGPPGTTIGPERRPAPKD